jgi:hypothetical protein
VFEESRERAKLTKSLQQQVRTSSKMIATKQRGQSSPQRRHHKVIKFAHKAALAAVATLLVASISPIRAQDLLRRTSAANQHQQNRNQNNPLANIQLPPQLASLSPQQLHQLAQLRELQLQQEAAAARQRDEPAQMQNQQAPAPLGLEAAAAAGGPLPTAPPGNGQSSGQIPQPTNADTTPTTSNNDRHDDGSYNESGSEMEGVAMSAGGDVAASSGSSSNQAAAGGAAAGSTNGGSETANTVASGAPSFEVNWNKCPQLEPSDSEKNKKTQVITKCLQSAPIPSNLTRENVEAHREQIATCALKVEGWFDDQGQYRYDKAETEIRGKRLDQAIESQVLKFHVACKDEASKKFPRDQNKLIDQVQFYQACMDYYISIVCEIEVSVDQ